MVSNVVIPYVISFLVFFFDVKYYFVLWIYHNSFILSLMDIWVLYSMYIFLFSHVHLQGIRNEHEGYFDSVIYWMSSNKAREE